MIDVVAELYRELEVAIPAETQASLRRAAAPLVPVAASRALGIPVDLQPGGMLEPGVVRVVVVSGIRVV